MIQFMSAKFQLNIQSVYFTWLEAPPTSVLEECLLQRRSFLRRSLGWETEKVLAGWHFFSTNKKGHGQMERKLLHPAMLLIQSPALCSKSVGNAVLNWQLTQTPTWSPGLACWHVYTFANQPAYHILPSYPGSILAADPAVLESICQEGPRKEQCITPCWLCTVIPHWQHIVTLTVSSELGTS